MDQQTIESHINSSQCSLTDLSSYLKFQKQNFNILYLNARSVKGKLDSIEAHLAQIEREIHVIVVSETWVKSHEAKYYNLPDYEVTYASRTKRGGGCAIFCKSNLKFNVVKNYEANNINYLQIYLEDVRLHIAAIYNPSNSNNNVNNTLSILQNELHDLKDLNLILLGDLNIDLLTKTNNCEKYKDIVLSNGFYFCNTALPTRKSKSLIDHIITNMHNTQGEVFIVQSDISDHDLQFFLLKRSVPLQRCQVYIKKTLDIQKIRKDLDSLNKTYDIGRSVDDNYEAIVTCFKHNTVYEQKQIKIKYNNKPWFTPEVKKAIASNNYYYRKSRQYPDNVHLINKCIDSKKKLKSVIATAKKDFFEAEFGKVRGNAKKEWEVINQIISNKNTKPIKNITSLKVGNRSIDDAADICESMNDYFISVAASLASKIKHSTMDLNNEETREGEWSLGEVNFSEVLSVINGMDPNKASGFDDIDIKTVKECRFELSGLLSKLFNQSFTSGIVPKLMKVSKVSPLFKSGDKENPNNYRPISVPPVLSKIMEKIVNSRLVKFLNDIDFLYFNQYGFRESSDTTSATVDLVSDIQKNLNNKKKGAVVALDLRKAFDTVNHDILLLKLRKLGISPGTFDWFSGYLSERRQFVSLGSIESSEKSIKCGVPQGSILGPTLFLIYINSISRLKLSGALRLYADDTMLVYFDDSLEFLQQRMTNDLNMIMRWLDAHKLTLNIEKSNYMFLSLRKIHYSNPLLVDGGELCYSKQIKYLGLWLDETLSWDYHTDNIRKKIRAPIGVLKRLSYIVPKRFLRPLYFSLIHCHLQYLAAIWFPARRKFIKPLMTLQNMAIKNLYCLPRRFSTNILYTKFNIRNLENIYKLQVCNFIHAVIKKDKHSSTTFVARNNVHNYNTRTNNHLERMKIRSNMGQNSIYYKGITVYNNIPASLRVLGTRQFKIKIKKHFL